MNRWVLWAGLAAAGVGVLLWRRHRAWAREFDAQEMT